jgi:cytochrome d ubiquinol oxidase subunit I
MAVIFNPSFRDRPVAHGLAAHLATALFVGASGAWHLLKYRDDPRVKTMFSTRCGGC